MRSIRLPTPLKPDLESGLEVREIRGVGRSFREIVHGRGRLRATRWPQSHHAAPAGSEDILRPPPGWRPPRCQCIKRIPVQPGFRRDSGSLRDHRAGLAGRRARPAQPGRLCHIAGGAENYLSWTVFASLLTAGRIHRAAGPAHRRIGAGYVLVSGPTVTRRGRAALLATLVVVSGLVQVVFMWQLSRIRRLLTPTVTGTVVMLMPVTVMPILFEWPDRDPAHIADEADGNARQQVPGAARSG